MPFTLEGQWVPEPEPSKPKKPILVLKERRGQSIVTIIQYLPLKEAELKQFCSTIKQKLGCGGSVKTDKIEIQGDKVDAIKAFIREQGLKVK